MRLLKLFILACLFSFTSPLLSTALPTTQELIADQKSDEEKVKDKDAKKR